MVSPLVSSGWRCKLSGSHTTSLPCCTLVRVSGRHCGLRWIASSDTMSATEFECSLQSKEALPLRTELNPTYGSSQKASGLDAELEISVQSRRSPQFGLKVTKGTWQNSSGWKDFLRNLPSLEPRPINSVAYQREQAILRRNMLPSRLLDPKRYWKNSSEVPSNSRGNFVFLSYNILSAKSALEHQHFLFRNVPGYLLDWDFRKRNILMELRCCAADVICLQEVDRYEDLQKELENQGFSGIYKARTGLAHDGCAIFWRKERFRLLHEESIEFKDFNLRDNVAQFCVLQMIGCAQADSSEKQENSRELIHNGSNYLVVGNIHVLFNPRRGDIKLGQVRIFLDRAHSLSMSWNGAPVLLGGDFNSTPLSAIYKLLATSEVDVCGFERKYSSGQESPIERVPISTHDVKRDPAGHTEMNIRTLASSTSRLLAQMRNDENMNTSAKFSLQSREPETGAEVTGLSGALACSLGADSEGSSCNNIGVDNSSEVLGMQNEENGSGGTVSIQSGNSHGGDSGKLGMTLSSVRLNSDVGDSLDTTNVDDNTEGLLLQEVLSNLDQKLAGSYCTSVFVKEDSSKNGQCSMPLDVQTFNEAKPMEFVELQRGVECVSSAVGAIRHDECMDSNEGVKETGKATVSIGKEASMCEKGQRSVFLDTMTLNDNKEVESLKLVHGFQGSENFAQSDRVNEQLAMVNSVVMKNAAEIVERDRPLNYEEADSQFSEQCNMVRNYEEDMHDRLSVQKLDEDCAVVSDDVKDITQCHVTANAKWKDEAVAVENTDVGVLKFNWSKEELNIATGIEDCTTIRHNLKLRSVYSEIEGAAGTRGVYQEPLVTTFNSQFNGTVDYVWFSDGLAPVRLLEVLPKHVLRQMRGLPTGRWSSDHLALVCELAFVCETQTVSEESKLVQDMPSST